MRLPILVAATLAAAPAVAQNAAVTPGQWQMKTTITDADMPGVPPMIAAMMKGRPHSFSHCVTPEEAAKGPRELLGDNKSCTFTRYSMSGGRIDTAMTCSSHGTTTNSTGSGSYTGDSFSVNSHAVVSGPRAMTMDATTTGTRVGACK